MSRTLNAEQQTDGRWRASCYGGCSRPLNWTVDTAEHAVNVANKHGREYHPRATPLALADVLPPVPATAPAPDGVPATVDLAAAARATLAMWAGLLGCDERDVPDLLLPLAEQADGVHAHLPPF